MSHIHSFENGSVMPVAAYGKKPSDPAPSSQTTTPPQPEMVSGGITVDAAAEQALGHSPWTTDPDEAFAIGPAEFSNADVNSDYE